MRILLITQWCEPEPTLKGVGFARALMERGHSVQVLTGFPNYPGGKLYQGYRLRPWQREVIDGVPVLRVPLFPSHSRSNLGRIANYVSFAVAAAVAALVVRRPDVAYLYHPPATAALPAFVLRSLRGVPFIVDIQDFWPDTLKATGMVGNQTVLRWVNRWMHQVYKRASRIVVLSDGFKEKLVAMGWPARKVSVIPNWTPETGILVTATGGSPGSMRKADRPFDIVFAGTMGKAQGLDTVIDAAEFLRNDQGIRFVFVGGGIEVESLQRRVADAGLPNVLFLPRRPPSQIGEVLDSADALLVHLRDDPLFSITVPSKIQAYLFAGKPILAGVRGAAAKIIDDAGAGLTFVPGDSGSLVEAARRLAATPRVELDAMGRRGRAYYDRRMSMAVGVDQFDSLVRDAAVGSSSYLPFKRVLDAVAAFTSLVLLLPILLPLAGLIRAKLGAPVLFRQERPGQYGNTFRVYKFRSMTDERDAGGELLPDADRLTPFGRFLRSSSLDELPSLLNILRGNMSLVGPRPLAMEYLNRYSDEHMLRHNVPPGLTGLAQVSGRNFLPFSQRLRLDLKYVRSYTLLTDLTIVVKTVGVVLRGSGVAKGESVAEFDDIALSRDLAPRYFNAESTQAQRGPTD